MKAKDIYASFYILILGLLKLFFNLMGIENMIKDRHCRFFQNCTHPLLLGNPSASMHTACSTE
jgi:hypothetical protein